PAAPAYRVRGRDGRDPHHGSAAAPRVHGVPRDAAQVRGVAAVELRVIGCHGGETPKHRTSAFIVDDRVAIDAGSLTSGMELKAQCALEAVLVSHAHLDHVRDL